MKKKKQKQPLSPEAKIFIAEAKSAWADVSQEDKDEYISYVIRTTPLRGTAAENKAFRMFLQEYKEIKRLEKYREGPEGMIAWVEDNVRFKIPDKHGVYKWIEVKDLPSEPDKWGRSSARMWEKQKEALREALQVDPKTGMYKYKLIVWCWPRGESKSFLTVLIALYRFFCFAFQRIYLTSTSKHQSDTLHFGEAKEIIENSPKLMEAIGPDGITRDVIRMGGKRRFNFIQLLSSISGIASNASLITQSEAFEHKKPDFFTKWYGSLRNVPNALGIIDTTVSEKGHWLHDLYKNYLKNPDGSTYFSYRYSKDAVPEDYWNPGMDEKEINNYKITFNPINFAKFFKNLWDTDSLRLFSEWEIQAVRYIGVDGMLGHQAQVIECLKKYHKLKNYDHIMRRSEINVDEQIETAAKRLWDIHDVYELGHHVPVNEETSIRMPSHFPDMNDLKKISDLYQTDFAILVGVDMADAMKKKNSGYGARSIVTWIAKGATGTKGVPISKLKEEGVSSYMYFLLGIAVIENNQPPAVIKLIQKINDTYGGIDIVQGETYGMSIVASYCDAANITCSAQYPTRRKQNLGFRQLIDSVRDGRFKAPFVPVHGTKNDDIFREELRIFDIIDAKGNPMDHKYGSPEKMMNGGIQDDVIDSIGWALYGGQEIGAHTFKKRVKNIDVIPGVLIPSSRELLQNIIPQGIYRKVKENLKKNLL